MERMVLYRELDPHLPDLGWDRVLPLALTPAAVRAVHECADAGALGAMAAAARSYWGAAGGIVMTIALGAVFCVLGLTVAAAISFGLFAPMALATMETRRRARQWQAVIEARLTVLAGGHR